MKMFHKYYLKGEVLNSESESNLIAYTATTTAAATKTTKTTKTKKSKF